MEENKFDGGLESPDEHCKQLRNEGVDRLADFYEWFEAETLIIDGIVMDLPLDKLDEQDFFDKSEAIMLLNAFILGSEFEQKFPSPRADK